MPQTTLLIDGDVYAFVAAAAAQKDLRTPEGFIYRWAFEDEGKGILDTMLNSLLRLFDADGYRVYLTEITPLAPNWRTRLSEAYKANRTEMERPQLLAALRHHLRTAWSAVSQPGLEADDLMGMAATEPHEGERRVIVTKDKDLRSVPGQLHIIGQGDENGKPVVETITDRQAHLWHMAQTLAGDRVDNFAGCPGLGMTRALRIVEKPTILLPEHGVVTRGPRKGETTTKWMSKPTKDLWACVVTHYQKAGLAEEDALLQARLARILHHGEYNWSTGEVKLWTP